MASTAVSSDTVTVANKLPNGVICRIFHMEEVDYPTPGGGFHKVKEARYSGKEFRVNGCAHEPGKLPNADGVMNGFALTFGIPKDLWEEWLKQNQDLEMVKNGLIFAHAQEASIKTMTKDNEKQTSGLEPMNPDGDPRNPRDPRTGTTVERGKVDA